MKFLAVSLALVGLTFAGTEPIIILLIAFIGFTMAGAAES